MQTITVNTAPSYPISIGRDLLFSKTLLQHCQTLGKHCVILTDSNVEPIYAIDCQQFLQDHTLRVDIITIQAGEANKTRETKAYIEDRLCELACGRDTVVIALGGGVVCDIAGFVAATYCRGIPVIYCPTTLLAMVDASIGGKTGVNTSFGKNLIGTFTQPRAVVMDLNTLTTLAFAELKNGFAEVIKHTLIADPAGFDKLCNDPTLLSRGDFEALEVIITQSCHIKRAIVEADPNESNRRQILNFGHTIGHAIEAVCDYTIRHGEAVAIGMWVESYLSMHLGILSEKDFLKIESLLKSYQLITELPCDLFAKPSFYQALDLDKKNKMKKPHFVLLEAIGKVYQKDQVYSHTVELTMLKEVLKSLTPCTHA